MDNPKYKARNFLQFKHFYDLKISKWKKISKSKKIIPTDWDLPDIEFSNGEIKNFPKLEEIGPRQFRLEKLKYERY